MIALLSLIFSSFSMAAPSYSLSSEIPIQSEGGWDYASVDAKSRRLFVTHGDRVVVIDMKKEKVIGEIQDTPGVHGFAIAPDLGRGFSSNGREGKVSIVDLKTLKTMQKVVVGQGPDAILYASREKEVYVFNGKSQSATVINAATGAVVTTIPLSGRPEFATFDPKSGKVFVNLEDKNSIAVIDGKKHQVVDNWPIAPGEEPTGLAMDVVHHRLLVGCHNKKMFLVDAQNGKVLDQIGIGAGVDSNWYDAEKQLAFSSNGDGTITIARVTESGKLQFVQSLPTRPRSRIMALDPISHKIYVPSAEFLIPVDPKSRPVARPGTFKVLVYSN